YITGPQSHSWWAMLVLMLVSASLYVSYAFSYLYLWTVSPEIWAPQGSPAPPMPLYPLASALLMIGGSAVMFIAGRLLPEPRHSNWIATALLLLATVAMVGATALEIWGHRITGLDPTVNGYGAIVYMNAVLQGQIGFAVVMMALFAAVRLLARRLDRRRRVMFDNAALLYYYATAQGLFGLLLVHGFPRMLG